MLAEATVESIHAAFGSGELTCVALVQHCLARIEAYDRQGPSLRALLTVNPDALKIAHEIDRQFREVHQSGGKLGALHGIPLIVKDNIDTRDMPTSGGNVAMRAFQPKSDAFCVARLRNAGALVLAKANLQEFARGGMSISSLGGQVLNPYDLTRTPGGSSGGTGAAIAAGFGVLGLGSDTGQSVRSPASACSLVGVRPSRGLVSRGGLMPNSFTQDEIGPIARSVKDAARMLDAMAGYDPADPVTALGVGRQPASYLAALDSGALKGARIGVIGNLFGREQRHAEVNAVMDQVIRNMQAHGALLQRFELPDCDAVLAGVATDRHEARAAMDRYLGQRPHAPFASLGQLVESRTAVPDIQRQMEDELALGDGMVDPDYRVRMLRRETLRLAVLNAMAQLGLDAILYPLQRVLVAHVGESEQPERNGALSHGSGLPAVTFPGGFSAPTASAPIGVPVGAELLGRDFDEARLLSLAHAYELAFQTRKSPPGTPPLG